MFKNSVCTCTNDHFWLLQYVQFFSLKHSVILTAEQETVHFNSNNVSKADSQSPLTQLDPSDMKEELPKADPAVFNRYYKQSFRIVRLKKKKKNLLSFHFKD